MSTSTAADGNTLTGTHTMASLGSAAIAMDQLF